MNKSTSFQTAFLVIAAAMTIFGGMIFSPGARFLFLSVAGLIVLVPLFKSASRAKRIIAFIILAAVVLQGIPAWKQFRSQLNRYRESAEPGGKTIL